MNYFLNFDIIVLSITSLSTRVLFIQFYFVIEYTNCAINYYLSTLNYMTYANIPNQIFYVRIYNIFNANNLLFHDHSSHFLNLKNIIMYSSLQVNLFIAMFIGIN